MRMAQNSGPGSVVRSEHRKVDRRSESGPGTLEGYLSVVLTGPSMKSYIWAAALLTLLSLGVSRPALAVNGEPYIHDPSTIAYDNGKYYVYGTGGGGLISDDGGWTWHSGAVRPGGGVAPDVIKIGDRFFMSYAVGG